MSFASINWLAVLVCVIFSVISGSLWFGPKTFFPVWWKAIGKSESEPPNGRPLTWVLLLVSSFVQAVFMAVMVSSLGSLMGGATLATGVATGFVLWLGFVAPASLVNKLFPSQIKAWAIEMGNHLINFVVFGAILGAWH